MKDLTGEEINVGDKIVGIYLIGNRVYNNIFNVVKVTETTCTGKTEDYVEGKYNYISEKHTYTDSRKIYKIRQ